MKKKPLIPSALVLALHFIVTCPLLAAPRAELSLRADPAHVSPNGDGLQDQAFFYPVLKSESPVLRWRLDVVREEGGRVARLTGAGMPALIMWDVLDRKGALSADGAYRARMNVWGRSFHVSTEESFFVDTVAPAVSVTVSTAAIDPLNVSTVAATVTLSARDASPIERWQLQIMDEIGRTVFLYWSTGAVGPVAWDGSDRQTRTVVSPGRYHAAFQAWDAGGNGSESAFADIVLAETSGDRVEGGLGGISVKSTTIGQLVQLDSDDLFAYRKGRIVLSDAAGAILTDLAAWINAYPKAAVQLEGYSDAYGNAKKDRNLGSRYAWLVYSHLVKEGEVKASRIQVVGRGREASALRRSAGLSLLANGVEVLLLEKR